MSPQPMKRLLRISTSLLASIALLGIQSPLLLPVAAQTTLCATPGRDGTPAAPISGVVNTYYAGQGAPAAGATSLPVGAPVGGPPIEAGDLLLVIQMQGATINSTNSDAYGNGVGGDVAPNPATPLLAQTPLQSSNGASGFTGTPTAGNYEYVVATGPVSGGNLAIRGAGAGGGLVNSYVSAPATLAQGQQTYQVVRVPQYASVTQGNVTAPAWNGSVGGVVVFDVAQTLTLAGTIDVSGRGFRGGGGVQLRGALAGTFSNDDFVTTAPNPGLLDGGINAANGSKGEGIAGTPRYLFDSNTSSVIDNTVEGYPGGSFARGAPANAGGGSTDGKPSFDAGFVPPAGFPENGNFENSGGGGGANGGLGGAGGRSWNYFASPFFLPGPPTSPDPAFGLATGGFGGAPYPATSSRVVLGGGGGAGTSNDGTSSTAGLAADGRASSGAAGGGIVLIRAATLSGAGTINANGGDAPSVLNDGGGGGGAGGSVVFQLQSGTAAGLTINVNGGSGGNAVFASPHGPGGGGGGGAVFATAGATVNRLGGVGGLTGNPPTVERGAQAGAGLFTPIPPADRILGASSGALCSAPPTTASLILIKRITSVTRSGVPTVFNQFVDDPNDTNDTAAGWAPQPPVGLLNTDPADPLKSGDEVEYTVYYLNGGGSAANAVNLCDPVPVSTSLINNTIQVKRGNTAAIASGAFFPPLAPLPIDNSCPSQTNTNGAILFDVGDVPNTSPNNIGFVRFRVKLN